MLFFEGELTLSWARQEFPCRAFPAFLRSVFVFPRATRVLKCHAFFFKKNRVALAFGSMKAPLGRFKSLLMLYEGCMKALLRLYEGSMKAL